MVFIWPQRFWLTAKGIAVLLFTVVAVVLGFGWLWGKRSRGVRERRKNLLIYGRPEAPTHKNALHHLGDFYNLLCGKPKTW